MPDISDASLKWIRLIYSTMVVESMFFGMYLIIALMSMYTLITKGLFKSKPRLILFIIMFLMLSMSTAHLVIHFYSYRNEFPTLNSDTDPVMDRLDNRLGLTLEIIERASYLLSDIIVVWRTWFIWYDNIWIKAYLAICLLATAATSLTLAVFNVFTNHKGTSYSTFEQNMLGTFCLLITNFSTTILCGYKAWIYRREVKAYLIQINRRTQVENILMAMVESGAAYCLFWVFMVMGDFGLFKDYGFEWWQPHFSGIYVASIVLMVSYQTLSPTGTRTLSTFNSSSHWDSERTAPSTPTPVRLGLLGSTTATATATAREQYHHPQALPRTPVPRALVDVRSSRDVDEGSRRVELRDVESELRDLGDSDRASDASVASKRFQDEVDI